MPSIQRFEGEAPEVSSSAFIHKSAQVIGRVSIGKESSLWPNVVIRGDVHQINIGQRTNIQDNSVVHVTHKGPYNPEGFETRIGDEVTVGHSATLHGCNIHNRVLIGIGCIVMDGATLEPDTILGAGSLVPPGKKLESGYLWLGSPAKKVRPLTEAETAFIDYSAEQYVQLKNRYVK